MATVTSRPSIGGNSIERANALLNRKHPSKDDFRQEMSKEDICNVDVLSLFELNTIAEDHWRLGEVDPERCDISDPPPYKGPRPLRPFRSMRR